MAEGANDDWRLALRGCRGRRIHDGERLSSHLENSYFSLLEQSMFSPTHGA
jgi:hypothetical protein